MVMMPSRYRKSAGIPVNCEYYGDDGDDNIVMFCMLIIGGDGLQAAQVRKSSFVSHANDSKGEHAYHPETHQSCTVHAGTVVQQVVHVALLSC